MNGMKKHVAIGCAILMAAVSITGCQSSTANTESGTESTDTAGGTQTDESDAVYGKVTAVDGNTVTLAMGTMEQMTKPDDSGDGTAPAGKPDEDGTTDETTGITTDTATDSGDTAQETPPEKPEGDSTTEQSGDGAAPGGEAPSGDMPTDPGQGGGQGGMPGNFTESGETQTITIDDESIIKIQGMGETTDGTLEDITVDAILALTYDGDTLTQVLVQSQNMGGGNMQGGGDMSGSETGSVTLTGAETIDGTEETADSETIAATEQDQNAVLVENGGTYTLTNATLTKSGDTSSADESNFYAVNSIFAAVGGSTASVSDTKLTSDAEGANAIFASGGGSTITADNVTIETTGNSSRGLDATYGGTVNASNVSITTQGAHCAPIATDREGGTVNVSDGTVSAAGDGSPCIYSTGDITAINVTGTAGDSQCAVIEGKNTATIENCNLTGNGANGIMLYQSTSGDAAEGTSVLNAKDSTLTTNSDGEFFYITNTDAEIDLENTTLVFSSGILLNASGNDTNNWGTPGENGGNVTLHATNQTLEGAVNCDATSTVALDFGDVTTYSGAIDADNTGDVTIALSDTATWSVSADSYVSVLTNKDEDCANIQSNGHTIYYDATNSDNAWLNGGTITLADGGSITPMA